MMKKPNRSNSTTLTLGICTFNRCDSLAITLASIVDLKTSLYDGDEIIVIDNNSSDSTKELVESFSKELPLRYVFEKKQGLSAARNRLTSESKADVVIFVDDDVTLYEGFVDEYRQAFQNYPNTGFFGGKLLIDWQGRPPPWYRDDSLPLINGLIIHYDLGDNDCEYDKADLLPYGASFALRASTIDTVGYFDESLGVKGTQIDRGEETDYFMRAIEAGIKGRYVANAKAGHRFDPSRITLSYLYSYGLAKGRFSSSVSELDGSSEKQTQRVGGLNFFIGQIVYGLRSCFQLLKGRPDRFYQSVINLGIRRSVYLQTKDWV